MVETNEPVPENVVVGMFSQMHHPDGCGWSSYYGWAMERPTVGDKVLVVERDGYEWLWAIGEINCVHEEDESDYGKVFWGGVHTPKDLTKYERAEPWSDDVPTIITHALCENDVYWEVKRTGDFGNR